jgi:hypothetical protein
LISIIFLRNLETWTLLVSTKCDTHPTPFSLLCRIGMLYASFTLCSTSSICDVNQWWGTFMVSTIGKFGYTLEWNMVVTIVLGRPIETSWPWSLWKRDHVKQHNLEVILPLLKVFFLLRNLSLKHDQLFYFDFTM